MVAKHVTGCSIFLVQFNNFDWTTGFYWSFTLLLKPPVVMYSWPQLMLPALNLPSSFVWHIVAVGLVPVHPNQVVTWDTHYYSNNMRYAVFYCISLVWKKKQKKNKAVRHSYKGLADLQSSNNLFTIDRVPAWSIYYTRKYTIFRILAAIL